MNPAKTTPSSPVRPGNRSTSRRQHGTARSVPVLFSLPTVQPSSEAHEGLPADSARNRAAFTAAIPDAPAPTPAAPPAASTGASIPAVSGQILNDSPAAQYPAAQESPVMAGEPMASPIESHATVVAPSARNWTSTFTNAAICVLVLALCALFLRNSNQQPSADTASRGKPIAPPSPVPPLAVPTAAPAIPGANNESKGMVTASSASDSHPATGDSFESPVTTSPIPGAAVSSSTAVQARLTESPNAPSVTTKPPAVPSLSVPSLLPANSGPVPGSKPNNATRPTAPGVAPSASRPATEPTSRPTMPAQGQTWDSSNLPSQPRRPASGAAMVPESIDPIEAPKPQRGHDAFESSHPQTARSESMLPADTVEAVAVDAQGLDEMDRVVHALAKSTSADSDVIPASFTANATIPESNQAQRNSSMPSASAGPGSTAANNAPSSASKLAEPVALNTRDIIQLRQSQRRGRETAWVSAPATGAMSKPVTSPGTIGNHAVSTATPAAPLAAGARTKYTPAKYTPVLTSADGVHAAQGDPAAPSSKPYLPLGSDWNLSMLDAADGPADVSAAPFQQDSSVSNGAAPATPAPATPAPATPRPAPYTPVSPKLPDPF